MGKNILFVLIFSTFFSKSLWAQKSQKNIINQSSTTYDVQIPFSDNSLKYWATDRNNYHGSNYPGGFWIELQWPELQQYSIHNKKTALYTTFRLPGVKGSLEFDSAVRNYQGLLESLSSLAAENNGTLKARLTVHIREFYGRYGSSNGIPSKCRRMVHESLGLVINNILFSSSQNSDYKLYEDQPESKCK